MLKIMLLASGLVVTTLAFADTLLMWGQKRAEPIMKYQLVHVEECGENNAGVFVVRLKDGTEIFYGRRDEWAVYPLDNAVLVDDKDFLRRDDATVPPRSERYCGDPSTLTPDYRLKNELN